MALAGTLKDFGIADILQLIGQQQKTGVLHLRSKDQEVKVGFKDGAIVSAESATEEEGPLRHHAGARRADHRGAARRWRSRRRSAR